MREEFKQEQKKEVTQQSAQVEILKQELTLTERTQVESKATENAEKKRVGKKKWGIIGAVVAVVIAIAVGIGIYNSPSNRLARQLELGNKYLEEQKYEEAVVAFEQAIEIDDRCMQAYVGGIEAYLNVDDKEGMEEFYNKSLDVIAELDSDFIEKNIDDIVDIYLYADDVYEDPKEVVTVLEKAMEVTDENPKVEEALIEEYLELAEKYTSEGTYDAALNCYDRLLELAAENEQVMDGLGKCLKKYIDVLMKEKRYEEIRQLAEKYGSIVKNLDFEAILEQIEELERIEAENQAFMQKVYDLMVAKDYEGIQTLEGTEEMQMFLSRMEENRFIYIPEDDGSRSGIGVGIYRLEEEGCYVFYGQYVEGIRSGSGTTYNTNSFGGYSEFNGAWKDDAPNGQGKQVIYRYMSVTGEEIQEIFSGNLVRGLFDGATTNAVIMGGTTYDMSCNVTMGIPEDKTAELTAQMPYITQMIAEGHYVYAYDNPGGKWYFAVIGEDMTMGVIGFRTE